MDIDSTVKIKRDRAQGAPVKAGECGTLIAIHQGEDDAEKAVHVVRVKGSVWYFHEEDLEAVDTEGIFEALAEALCAAPTEDGEPDLLLMTSGLEEVYSDIDLTAPVQPELPFPTEVEEEEPTEDADLLVLNEEEAEVVAPEGMVRVRPPGHEDCPEGPHYHPEDGPAVPLPFLALTDNHDDVLEAIDIRAMDGDAPDLVLRVSYPSQGRRQEVHLSESQALALVAFLIRTYGPPRG